MASRPADKLVLVADSDRPARRSGRSAGRAALASTRLPPEPVRAELPQLGRDMTVAMAAHRVLKSCLLHLLDNRLPVLKGSDPEAIHQARVALRRLRAAIAIFKSALRSEEVAFLGDEARWLAGELGPARDLDVFLAEVFEPVADACAGAEGLAAYRGAAQQLQRQRLARAREAFRSRRFAAWRERFRSWLAADVAPPVAVVQGDPANPVGARYRPIAVYAADILTRRDRKMRKRGHQVTHLKPEELHNLRKSIKKLRYAAEFFGDLYDSGAGRYVKRLSRLQDVLGHFNDVAVAQSLMRDIERATARDSQAGAAISSHVHHVSGLIAGWHAAHGATARKRLRKRWRALHDTDPFWP